MFPRRGSRSSLGQQGSFAGLAIEDSQMSGKMSAAGATEAGASGVMPNPSDSTFSQPMKSAAGAGPSLMAFRDEAAVDTYLCNLANELMLVSDKPATIFKTSEVDPVESLGKMVSVLDSAQDSLADVQSRASRHVSYLQDELSAHEKNFVDTLDNVDNGMDRTAADFRAIDTKTSGLSAAAATTGTRLAAAHRITAASKTALDVLSHLWTFSMMPTASIENAVLPGKSHRQRGSMSHGPWGDESEAGEDGSLPGTMRNRASATPQATLDPVFTDNSRLSEAAALVEKMLPLAREVHLSNKRLGLVTDEIDKAAPGTVEAALRNLIAYRSSLENRLLARFMDACSQTPADLRDMARCCKNLGHFGAENSAVKGYIAMMPLFQRTSEYVSHPPWLPGSSQKDKRSYQLQKSLQELVDTIMKEKSVFSLVFSTWQEALDTLVVRIVEEKAEPLVATVVDAPDPADVPDPADLIAVLDMYLALLRPAKDILGEFVTKILKELPVKTHAQQSLEALSSILQRPYMGVEQQWLAAQWRRSEGNRPSFSQHNRTSSFESPPSTSPTKEPPSHFGTSSMIAHTATGGARGATQTSQAMTVAPSGLSMPAPLSALRDNLGSALKDNLGKIGVGEDRLTGARDTVQAQADKAKSFFGGAMKAGVAAMRWRMHAQESADTEAVVDAIEAEKYINWHRIVINRAMSFLPPNIAATHIGTFFHKKVPSLPPCCLLDQLVTHCLAGITAASKRSVNGFRAPLNLPMQYEAGQSAVTEAVNDFMSSGPVGVLQAVAGTGQVVEILQRHFHSSVQPRLAVNSAAAAESSAALTQLTQVLEKSIEGSLNAVADSFDSLLGRVLSSEQKRTDFQPSEMGSMGHMDTPTPACGAVTGLLRSLLSSVEEMLPVGASGSFLLEVGMSLRELLMQHMLRFKFSMFGALQWKRDMADYQEAASRLKVQRVTDAFDQLCQLANTLIVPPETLLEVVDAGLQMDRTTARKYVALREDYQTAKVDGKSLATLLGEPALRGVPGST